MPVPEAARRKLIDPNVRKQKYFESGERYFEKGKYREAVIQYRNATDVDGSFAAAHFKLAESYMKLQDWQRAYQEFTRTVELQPDNYKAHLEIATLLIAEGQAEQLKAAQDHVVTRKTGVPLRRYCASTPDRRRVRIDRCPRHEQGKVENTGVTDCRRWPRSPICN